jgi:solute carrier family 25 (adenine nucleotide translocator) protein 4/5/6/31
MKRSRTPSPTEEAKPVVVPKIPKWQHAIAGASAGVFSKTAVAPVERVKLLMQLQGSVNRSDFTNPWKVAKHIYHTEGILAFWRGNWPNVIRTAGQAAFNFSFMDYYKAVASSPAIEAIFVPGRKTDRDSTTTEQNLQRRRQLVVSFVSGGLAGATSTTVFYPTEYLRTRLAMDQGRSWQEREYKGMKDVIVKTVRADGILGVYNGYSVALYGSILHRLLYLGGYDAIKNEVLHYKKGTSTTLSFGERFLLAQGVSLGAGTLCYPIDSVRRRLMMQAGKPKEARLYRGSLDCFKQVWVQEGMRGFFLGLSANIVRSVGGALMLVSYDVLKSFI